MSKMARVKGEAAAMQQELDFTLLFSVVTLVVIGLIMVSSASTHLGDRFGSSFYFLNRHLLALIIGGIGGFLCLKIPTQWWEKSGAQLYFLGIFVLALLVIPGVGKEVNGAVRWVSVGGFNLQVSEFMKLALILYLAGYLVRRKDEVAISLWGFIKPMLLLLIACSLIMWQPDFGTTSVLLVTAFGMLFLGGAPLWQFVALTTAASATLVGLVLTSPYRMERVTSFLNPWADPLDSGYQLSQALIAFGRGEWTGVGLGNGIQKQFYLPEAHTDFLMAVIGEELGFIGTLAVILLFGVLIWKIFQIGARADALGRRFQAHVAYGTGMWIGLQAFINIGVNMGLLPTKGLTLPFMSYGSNSLIVSLISMAILLRIQLENNEFAKTAEVKSWQRA